MPFDIEVLLGFSIIFLACWFVGFIASKVNGLQINIVKATLIGLVSIVFSFIVYLYTEEGLKDVSSVFLFIFTTVSFGSGLIYFSKGDHEKHKRKGNAMNDKNEETVGHYVYDSDNDTKNQVLCLI